MLVSIEQAEVLLKGDLTLIEAECLSQLYPSPPLAGPQQGEGTCIKKRFYKLHHDTVALIPLCASDPDCNELYGSRSPSLKLSSTVRVSEWTVR